MEDRVRQSCPVMDFESAMVSSNLTQRILGGITILRKKDYRGSRSGR